MSEFHEKILRQCPSQCTGMYSYGYTVPKEIDFPRYNMKFSGENMIVLRGIFHVVSCFPLHFMLYRGHVVCFYNSNTYSYLRIFLSPKYFPTCFCLSFCKLQYLVTSLSVWLPPCLPGVESGKPDYLATSLSAWCRIR